MSAPNPTAVEPAIVLRDLTELAPFSFRWPEGPEEFQTGWELTARVGRHEFRVRHGLGIRDTYGRSRVHAVTWLNGNVEVEGVEADDYAVTRSLISLLRRDDRKHVRRSAEVPDGYDAFEIVGHRREIDAPHSPRSLAVKIREDDLGRWAAHAWIRHEQRGRRPRPVRARTVPAAVEASSAPPPAPRPDAGSVVAALLAHGEALSARQRREGTVFTPDPAANTFVQTDPFAFLVAVISDQGITAERAWATPHALRQRLGHLDVGRVAAEPGEVAAAFQQPPKLHRFVNQIPRWISQAAGIIVREYGGEAGRIWSDRPAAAELRERLEQLPGIGQKKAAMAVEILERDLGVPLTSLSGSDIAYDVHLRRVFLRTGMAERDDVSQMVTVARSLHPERPGALDYPAWDIGRRWCKPSAPDCATCPLVAACPQLIERGSQVRGV